MTIIFTDSFESNFINWEAPIGTISISNIHPYGGQYGCKWATGLNYVAYNYAPQDESYIRAYFYFSEKGAGILHNDILLMSSWQDWGIKVAALITVDNTFMLADWTSTLHDTAVPVELNRWYCVEIGFKKAVAGWSKLWVDGVLLHTEAGDSSGVAGGSIVRFGTSNWGGFVMTSYGDDVVVADAYIGPAPNILFADGFESGDFSKWTSTVNDGGGSAPLVQTGLSHNGNYNMKGEVTGVDQSSGVTKEFSASAIVYFRFYMQLNSVPGLNKITYYAGLFDAAFAEIVYVFIRNTAGINYWGFYSNLGSVSIAEAVASNPVANKFYCVELMRDNTNNVATLWVDGIQKATQAIAFTADSTGIAFGINNSSSGSSAVFSGDDVVVADGYIGLARNITRPLFTLVKAR
jgi:hypothetical protein